MNLTDIIKGLSPFEKKGATNIGFSSNPLADFAGLIAGRVLYPDINEKKYVNDYCNNSEVYAIIKRIAKTISTVPFYEYSINSKKHLNQYKSLTTNAQTTADLAKAELVRVKALSEIIDSETNKLLQQPNEYQSFSELIENLVGYKLITGNSYLWANRLESGKIQELVVLPSQYVAIVSDGTINGVEAYTFTLVGWDNLPASEVIHMK